MSTIQQELIIQARADVTDARQGLASLDKSVDGLASAQEGLKTASEQAAKGLGAEAAAATDSARATEAAAKAAGDAADAARKLGADAKGAGSGMDKATGEARKLSKQIKDVADDMDVAAGKMVQGLGGGGAIKALGGVSIAFGAVTAGAQAFMGSAESLFNSFGEEGQKVWGETTKSIDEIKGAFAEAVLGGGSVEEMGARLKGIFDGLKTATNFVLTPVKLLAQAFWGNSEASIQAAKGVKEYNEAVVNSKKNQIALSENLKSMRLIYAELIGDTKTLTRYRYEDKIAALQAGVDEIKLAAEVQNAKIAANVAVAASGRIAESAHAATEMMVFRGFLQREKAAEHEKNLIEENTRILIEQTKARNLAMVGGRGAAIAEGEAMIRAAQAEMGRVLTTGPMNGPFLEETGNKAGKSFVTGVAAGIKKGMEENSIFKDFKDWWKTNLEQVVNPNAGLNLEQILDLGGTADKYTGSISPVKYMSEAEREAAKQKAAAESEAELQKVEIGLGMREDPAKAEAERLAKQTKAQADAKALADSQKAAADAAKAESQKQIQDIQETSGAVLDLAGAFATLSGVQDGVIDKMRQVVDVVVKIMQATEALQSVQVAQAATAQATAAVNATAAATTAAAATSAGAAAAGAGASAGSAFVPVLGAVTAVVGLLGSLFGGGSEAPRRDRGGSSKTIYTSAGEAQGAGGDFAYFEGGRQNVTIVTNDAASIRTMQGRLAFVGSRGGSGF